MLKAGEIAPNFQLKNQAGTLYQLADFKGKKVVVYFYPKDNTPGCTKQACAFASSYDQFKERDVQVIGISKDSETSHQKFAEKYNLPFLLLADPELSAIKAYDVWQEKKMYGKTYMGVMRSTFVINEAGVIIKVFEKANPTTNAEDILKFLQ